MLPMGVAVGSINSIYLLLFSLIGLLFPNKGLSRNCHAVLTHKKRRLELETKVGGLPKMARSLI
jgi:hypothetical protein